jgi:phage-related protein
MPIKTNLELSVVEINIKKIEIDLNIDHKWNPFIWRNPKKRDTVKVIKSNRMSIVNKVRSVIRKIPFRC